MRFDAFLAKPLGKLSRIKLVRASRDAPRHPPRDLKDACFGRIDVEAAADLRMGKGFLKIVTARAVHQFKTGAFDQLDKLRVRQAAWPHPPTKLTGMVLGRLCANKWDRTRVLQSRC
jgi:hypothetical protein